MRRAARSSSSTRMRSMPSTPTIGRTTTRPRRATAGSAASTGCARTAPHESLRRGLARDLAAGRGVTLAWIVLATALGGLLSVIVAAALTLAVLSKVVHHLVSLSTGVLLATALLDVL